MEIDTGWHGFDLFSPFVIFDQENHKFPVNLHTFLKLSNYLTGLYVPGRCIVGTQMALKGM